MFSPILIICILISAILPFIWAGYSKFMGPGYNNSTTRDFISKLEGKCKRAHYAQLNHFEALPLFFISLTVAVMNSTHLKAIETTAMVFVVARIMYGLCYIFDQATARSLIWMVALGCNIYLLVLSL